MQLDTGWLHPPCLRRYWMLLYYLVLLIPLGQNFTTEILKNWILRHIFGSLIVCYALELSKILQLLSPGARVNTLAQHIFMRTKPIQLNPISQSITQAVQIAFQHLIAEQIHKCMGISTWKFPLATRICHRPLLLCGVAKFAFTSPEDTNETSTVYHLPINIPLPGTFL